jgi:ribosomal protein S18 acetylase RimI-like enzyme
MHSVVIDFGTEQHMEELVNSALWMMEETEGLHLDRQTAISGAKAVLANKSHGFYVVATANNQFAGSLFVNSFWLDLVNGYVWWINCVHVREEFRRQGIYEQMYNFVKEQVTKREDVVALRLIVNPANAKAKDAYEKAGMSQLHYLLYQEKVRTFE